MMDMKTAIVTDIRAEKARQTADWLEENGYRVIRRTAEDPEEAWERLDAEAVDLLVICVYIEDKGTDGVIGTSHPYDEMLEQVCEKVYEPYDIVEHCLPYLEKGQGKRIAFLTEKASGITGCEETGAYARHMILAGCNFQAKMLFNRLRPQGYTMRCYAADSEGKDGDGICAGEYICMNFCYDEKEPYIHSDENRFVMRDKYFREIQW